MRLDGGARSPLWRQIFADVLEVPIRWRPTSGGTSLGSAFLAAQSCATDLSMADLSSWLEPTEDTFPNLNWVILTIPNMKYFVASMAA